MEERRYEDGQKANVLDIVCIPMLKPEPDGFQTENHLIDDKYYWVREGVENWDTVQKLVEPIDGPLWVNGHSTYHGHNDKVPEKQSCEFEHSLILVEPTDLRILVRRESGFSGPDRRRIRAQFTLAGKNYLLQVTDPVVEETYLTKKDGTYPIEKAILCISLSEVWNKFAFKLVATILTPDLMK